VVVVLEYGLLGMFVVVDGVVEEFVDDDDFVNDDFVDDDWGAFVASFVGGFS
jgi:hypothetical protein